MVREGVASEQGGQGVQCRGGQQTGQMRKPVRERVSGKDKQAGAEGESEQGGQGGQHGSE